MLFRRIATATFALTLAACQAQTPSQKAQAAKDEAEIQAYTLTMDTITRLIQATHDLTLLKPAAGPKEEADDSDGQQSLDQQAARLAKHPEAVALFAKYGFTPRKYTVAFSAYLVTGIAIAGIDSGASVEDMVTKAHMNPANIALVRAHKAEIDELAKKYPMQNQ
jgi:hypothetical protein